MYVAAQRLCCIMMAVFLTPSNAFNGHGITHHRLITRTYPAHNAVLVVASNIIHYCALVSIHSSTSSPIRSVVVLCTPPVGLLVLLLCQLFVWARERCRISPSRFLAEYRKRRLYQASFVSLSFALFAFYRAMHFSAKRGIAIACRLSVRL